jgi:hypothetical protein
MIPLKALPKGMPEKISALSVIASVTLETSPRNYKIVNDTTILILGRAYYLIQALANVTLGNISFRARSRTTSNLSGNFSNIGNNLGNVVDNFLGLGQF